MNTALLIVDVQRGLFEKGTPVYRAEELIENINHLIEQARKAGAAVIFVQHSDKLALPEGSPSWQMHPQLAIGENDITVHKRHPNAFEETELSDILSAKNIQRVIVCGLVTHGCIKATCLGAKSLGYQVVLVSDSHSSYSKTAGEIIDKWNTKLKLAAVELASAREIGF